MMLGYNCYTFLTSILLYLNKLENSQCYYVIELVMALDTAPIQPMGYFTRLKRESPNVYHNMDLFRECYIYE